MFNQFQLQKLTVEFVYIPVETM